MTYNLKAIKQEFKERGIFYTPPELAELMKEYAPKSPKNVYDPTCGDGALLAQFGNIPKYGQEINDHQLEVAKEQLSNFTGYCGDTLKDPAFMDMRFSCIMANPPFSIKWEPVADERFIAPVLPPPSKADYAFIMHILHMLDDDGTAVVLNFPGILYRGQREAKIRQWLVEQNYIDKVVNIPGDTFVDTKIATALLVLKKNRRTTDIQLECRALNMKRTVTAKQIEENDFNLSVSSYIQEEIIKEDVDPIDLEMTARAELIRYVETSIQMSKMIGDIEKLSINPLLDGLQKLIDKYRAFN